MSRVEDQKPIDINEAAAFTDAVSQANRYTDDKFKLLNGLMIGVVIVVGAGFIAMVFTLVFIVLDQMHFNSTIYQQQVTKNQESSK